MTSKNKLRIFFTSFLIATLALTGCDAGGSYEHNGIAIGMSPAKTIENKVEKEILTKSIQPFLDYYAEKGMELSEVRVDFVDMTLIDSFFPYKATVAYGGEKEGQIFSEFLIEEINGEIAWWVPPACDIETAPCSFSAEYAEKYPYVYERAEYKEVSD